MTNYTEKPCGYCRNPKSKCVTLCPECIAKQKYRAGNDNPKCGLCVKWDYAYD